MFGLEMLPRFSLVKCILLRWCLYAPLEMKGVSQNGHFIAPSPPAAPAVLAAWFTAHEKARMAPGSDIGDPEDDTEAELVTASDDPLAPEARLDDLVWSSQKLISEARALPPAGFV